MGQEAWFMCHDPLAFVQQDPTYARCIANTRLSGLTTQGSAGNRSDGSGKARKALERAAKQCKSLRPRQQTCLNPCPRCLRLDASRGLRKMYVMPWTRANKIWLGGRRHPSIRVVRAESYELYGEL